jgi:hypothetical protein
MELYDLYKCFTDEDKRNISRWLKNEKVKATNELLIRDWIRTVDASVRLHNAIANYDNNIFPSQITKQMLLSHRNVGITTWREFQNLRGDNI